MAKRKNQHVVPRNGEGAVQGAGNTRATAIVGTQKEAIQIARGLPLTKEAKCSYMAEMGR